MSERGRPPIVIDIVELDKLCGIQATGEECASWFNIDYDTLNAALMRQVGMNFSEYFRQKKGRGKVSLRRKQMQSALDGNVPMMIWLGKQYLGQSESGENNVAEIPPINITLITDDPDKATD